MTYSEDEVPSDFEEILLDADENEKEPEDLFDDGEELRELEF